METGCFRLKDFNTNRFHGKRTWNFSMHGKVCTIFFLHCWQNIFIHKNQKVSLRGAFKVYKRIYSWTYVSLLFTEGRTGVPFVDANMREVALTGFMSNRGRQNVASFLTKDLGLDWRMGAEWFESLLVSREGQILNLSRARLLNYWDSVEKENVKLFNYCTQHYF